MKQTVHFGLEALRGIGITGIVLYHFFPAEFPGGFLGVPLFFVLSGYLMFLTSEARWKKGTFHIKTYYIKRIKKIYVPLFTLVVGVCSYLTLFRPEQLAGRRAELGSILLGYNNLWQIQQNASYFSRMANASPFTHLWFLSLEIQFYLLWPVLFLLYRKGCQIIHEKKLCFVFLGLALVSAGRMMLLFVPGQDPSRVYYGTDTMAFPLLLGIFLGAFRQQHPNIRFTLSRKRGATVLLGIFILLVNILFLTVDGQADFIYPCGMFLVSLLFATMICLLEDNRGCLDDLLETSLVAWIGRHSYLLYLWHYPVVALTF